MNRATHAERSGKQSHGLTNRNRIRGGADQGERACNRKALAIKDRRRRSGSRVVKGRDLTWGDLESRPKGRRSQERSEKSAAVVVADMPRRPARTRWSPVGRRCGSREVLRSSESRRPHGPAREEDRSKTVAAGRRASACWRRFEASTENAGYESANRRAPSTDRGNATFLATVSEWPGAANQDGGLERKP